MEFSMESGALARAVGLVKSCVANKTTMPILTHIVIDATGDALAVRGTDLDKEAEAVADAEIVTPGAIAVPGDVLHGIVKRMGKSDRVTFKLDNHRVTVSSARSKYQLRTLPVDEFSSMARHLTGGTTFAIGVATLRGLLETVLYAVCRDEKQWTMAGVRLHVVGDKLVAVATCGKRFAYREAPVPAGAEAMSGVTVPTLGARTMADFLSDADGEALVTVNDAVIKLELARVTFYSRLIDGNYPNYAPLIPAADSPTMTVRPKVLAEAVERAGVVYTGTDEKYPGIKFVAGAAGVDLVSGILGGDEAVEDVAAEVHDRGDAFILNANWLAEMLKIWPDIDIDVQTNGVRGPVLFTAKDAPDQKHIIMPQQR